MNWDLVVIFLFVLAVMYLRYKMRAPGGAGLGLSGSEARLAPGDQAALERAEAHARRLEERIGQLERVLDEDAPGWRGERRL